MRLLNTLTLNLEDFPHYLPKYAILSHRWRNEEVTFKDVQSQRHHSMPAFSKIRECCKLAASRWFPYVWIDTCCIDKSSSAELNEAINSMFRWYQDAGECYVYLHDVDATLVNIESETTKKAIKASVWFKRGWTLQELIAPENVYFFNASWTELGIKSEESLGPLIEEITAIDGDLLCGRRSLSRYSIAQRMSWAASRQTTRIEDEAYSLLGILEVHMPMLYGEGKHAFRRLQEEVIKQSDDQTIFAWGDRRGRKSILAPSPSCFRGLQDAICVYPTNDDRTGYTLANSGLSIQAMLIPWSMNVYLLPLGCGSVRNQDTRTSMRGYNRICILVKKAEHPGLFVRVTVNGLDIIELNSDHVATIRDNMRIQSHRIILRQNLVGINTPNHFHGFHFKYSGARIFKEETSPHIRDIVCFHNYNPKESIFKAKSPGLHAIGAFRLSSANASSRYSKHISPKSSTQQQSLIMYFGFDLDFAPICLVTSAIPDLSEVQKDIWADDLSKLNSAETLSLLNLQWLLEQLEQGKTSENVLAFRGSPHQSTTVTCRNLSLRMLFSLEPCGNGIEIWTVTFEDWQGPVSTVILESDHTDSRSERRSSQLATDMEEISVVINSTRPLTYIPRGSGFS